jgi:hypothetical protein
MAATRYPQETEDGRQAATLDPQDAVVAAALMPTTPH